METLRVGFIGTGKKPVRPGPQGYGMAHQHAAAYRSLPSVKIVACADISRENAKAFAELFDVDTIYTDYHEMLAEEKLRHRQRLHLAPIARGDGGRSRPRRRQGHLL